MDVAQLTPADRSELREHLAECWTATYAPLFGKAVVERMIEGLATGDVGGVLSGNDETGFAVRRDGSIIGTCVGVERHTVMYAWGCYVRPEFQQQGIGTALMDAVQRRHPSAVTDVVQVLERSTTARSFYERLGFSAWSQMTYELVPGCAVDAIEMKRRR